MVTEDLYKRRGKTIPNKKPLSVEIKKSIYMLMCTLLIIGILVSIVYMLNSSQSNQKGYVLKQNQLEKDNLIEENRNLINKIIEAKAFSEIENNPQIKNMFKPEKVTYVDPEPQQSN
jgi:hypothetical protein